MVSFVANDQEVDLELEISGPNSDSIKNFEFIFTRASDGERVDKVKGSVDDKKMGTGTWKAKGIKDDEVSARINWEAKAGDLQALGRGELVVYHDTITVVTKNEDGEPVEKAMVEVKVKPDPAYTAKAMRTGSVRRTDGEGKIVFDDLPPGEVTVAIRTPYKLLEWVQDTGIEREAKVEKKYSAKLVWPDASALNGDDHHKQYINMAVSPSHPEQGSLMKIKVKVDPDTAPGGGTVGDKLYVKVKYGDNNSERNDNPKPMFGTNEGGKGKGPFVVEKALTSDGQTVEFDLELGAAGGDEVEISVGADEACTDGDVKVVSWRKIWIKPAIVQGFPLPNNQVDPDLQDKINSTLLPTFIETEFESALTVQSSHAVVVDQQRARAMNLANHAQAPFVWFSDGNPEKEHVNAVVSDNPLRLYWFLGHVFYSVTSESFKIEFKGRTSGWQTSKESNNFLPVTPTGGAVLKNWREASAGTRHKITGHVSGKCDAQPSHWAKNDGRFVAMDGEITINELEFHPSQSKFRVVLPNNLGIGRREKIVARVKLKTFGSFAGSSTNNWVAGAYKVGSERSKLSTLYTILHELGHSLGQAAAGNRVYPGLPDEEHPHQYNGKGHQGSHCNKGLSTSDAKKDNYSPLVAKGTHGTCIMFGGIGPKTKLSKCMKFCDVCEPYVKAVKFTSL